MHITSDNDVFVVGRQRCFFRIIIMIFGVVVSLKLFDTANGTFVKRRALKEDMLGEQREIGRNVLAKHSNGFCGDCSFATASLPQGKFIHVKLNSTGGFGRTGNYVIAIQSAFKLAYLCKAVLELPAFDIRGDAFNFSSHRFFDFRSLEEDAIQSPECTNTDTDTFHYYHLNFGTHDIHPDSHQNPRIPATDDHVRSMRTNHCLQRYLGICSEEEEFCHGLEDVVDERTVVAHFRQGDIYPPNFDSNVHPSYGQPPLSFYLSVFDFLQPNQVIAVSEPSHEGPVWRALRMLHDYKTLRYNITFQSGHFRDDLRLMLCAKTFVESSSTLMTLVRLGFATKRFLSSDCQQPTAQTKIYSCDVDGDYHKYYHRHTNAASEWVDALLQRTQAPRLCQL